MSPWQPWEPWDRGDGLNKGLDDDPLLEFLGAKNPTKIPDLFVLVGIVGRAPDRDIWRVYVNFALSEFFEIDQEHIQYAGTSEDGRTRVWIHAGAPMRHVRHRPTRAERTVYAPGPAASPPEGGGEAFYLSGPFVESGDWWQDDPNLDGGPVGTGCKCRYGTN